MPDPLARSPIEPPEPVVAYGWVVSGRRSSSALRLTDCAPLAKVSVRAEDENGPLARALGVRYGRATRDAHDTLVIGAGPGEWHLVAAPGAADQISSRVDAVDEPSLVSVLDVTHGRALMRITGVAARALMGQLCPVDLDGRATPSGAAFRSLVADVTTLVVRDDLEGESSYLLACEWASGQFLFDALLEAGGDLGVDVDGFVFPAV